MQRSLQIDKLIVSHLTARTQRNERGMFFRNFEYPRVHTTPVLFYQDLVPAFADGNVAVGRDEVRQVDL